MKEAEMSFTIFYNIISFVFIAFICKQGGIFQHVDTGFLCRLYDHAMIAAGNVVVSDVPGNEVWESNLILCNEFLHSEIDC